MSQGYVRPDGTGDECRLTTALPDLAVGLTICGWFRKKSTILDFQPVIWAPLTGDGSFFFLGWNSGSALYFQSNAWAAGLIEFSTTPPADEWFFAALTWIDGDPVNGGVGYWFDHTFALGDTVNASTDGLSSALSYLEVGCQAAFTHYADVLMSQVRVFDAVLSQAELEAEMLSTTPVHASCVSAWEDDPTVDVSGNGNEWTNVGLLSGDDDWPPNYDIPSGARGCAIRDAVSTATIRLTEAIDLVGDGITVTCWLKVVDVAADNYRPIVYIRGAGGGRVLFVNITDGAYTPVSFLRSEGNLASGLAEAFLYPPPVVGDWYAYAVRLQDGDATSAMRAYDATLTEVYEEIATGDTGGALSTQYVALASEEAGRTFGCKVAQGRVWSRMLSEAEILAELASRTPVITFGLVSAFEDDPEVDVSGHGRPWTISDVTVVSDDWPPNYPIPDDPAIASVSDAHVYDGQVGVTVTGTDFGTQGAGSQLVLSPTDDGDDPAGVVQTVTAWSATSITFTVAAGALPVGETLYLFVVTDIDGLSNATGFPVELFAPYVAPAVSIKHAFVSNVADGPADGRVRPSNWNAEHVVDGIEPDLGRPEQDGFLASDSYGTRYWTQPASSDAPASAAAVGIPGQVAYTSTHVYVCIAPNTWKRAAIATW